MEHLQSSVNWIAPERCLDVVLAEMHKYAHISPPHPETDMHPFILAFASIFYKLADIIAAVCSLFDASPPQVPSFLGGYDNGLLYALNPNAFLARCQQRYGSVYRVWIGSWRFKVVSCGDAISSVLSAPPELLRNDTMHQEVFYVIAGATTNPKHLHEFMVRELFPLVDKAFSLRSLGQTTHSFGLVLLSHIKKVVEDHSGPISITELTNRPLYAATNLLLLGRTFPDDTYSDFQTLSRSIPYRFTKMLLWRWPSHAARTRLLRILEGYLQQGEVTDCDDGFSPKFKKAFRDNNIRSLEGAQLVLNFLWGVHTNTLSNALFLLSFLLGDPSALARIRTEVDVAVEKFGGLETLLEAGPDKLDDSLFQLLTSAIMETMRLTALHAGIREAACDFNLKIRDGFLPIKKGEYVFGNVRSAHTDAAVYPNPEMFVVDRFAQQPYRKKQLQTLGYPFHSLGGGRHICKGRWLAIYETKLLFIILFHKFDFVPAEEGSVGWTPLRVHPRSIGAVHTEDDIFVRLSPRQLDGL